MENLSILRQLSPFLNDRETLHSPCHSEVSPKESARDTLCRTNPIPPQYLDGSFILFDTLPISLFRNGQIETAHFRTP